MRSQFPLSANYPVGGQDPPIMVAALSFADDSCGVPARTLLTTITFDATHPTVTVTKARRLACAGPTILCQPFASGLPHARC